MEVIQLNEQKHLQLNIIPIYFLFEECNRMSEKKWYSTIIMGIPIQQFWYKNIKELEHASYSTEFKNVTIYYILIFLD